MDLLLLLAGDQERTLPNIMCNILHLLVGIQIGRQQHREHMILHLLGQHQGHPDHTREEFCHLIVLDNQHIEHHQYLAVNKMEEKKRRFVTIELCPCLSDEQEKMVKESIAQGIKDLSLLGDQDGALYIPKRVLLTKFENDSDIVVVKNNIIRSV
jgi:hypothetical protein